jgi:hypothetical protein
LWVVLPLFYVEGVYILNTYELAQELLSGGFDLHVHTDPDIHQRRIQDDLEYARAARDACMGGAVFKNHYSLTSDRAALVRKEVPGIEIFGGLCLDGSAGINVYAVETALQFVPDEPLTKIVWMPTIHARQYAEGRGGAEGPRYGLLDESGQLMSEVYEIIDLIRDGGAALATGHISFEEMLPLVRAASARGLERIIVTHVDAPYLELDAGRRLELSRYGYLEYSFIHCLPTNVGVSLTKVVESMSTVGFDRCIISSDLGQVFNMPPVSGMLTFIQGLLHFGASADDVKSMVAANPRRLLSI